jgi:hypothetical protein
MIMSHPPRRPPSVQWIEREKFIEAFETARATNPDADLADFLPALTHPLYLPVLEELVRIDLEHHWVHARPRWLEEYFGRFPLLLEASASVRTLAFEEFRLRRQAGQAPTTDEYRDRFGIDPGRAIRDDKLDLVPGPRTPPPRTDRFAQVMAALPHVGDLLLDYRLVAELGAGAFGQVFLAERAGVRVALKVSPALGGESVTPARLRHPNIVPVEEVFEVGSFRAVVMPYLGAFTLAHVLKALADLPQPPIWGRVLFTAIRPGLPPAIPQPGDAGLRTALESVSFADAVVWIGVQIAAGLARAHRQGVLHLDLKPANVLWTDAGRPMLLDFHLAAAGQNEPAGGTLPYMSPEQIDAFRGTGRVVDGRADLFALGVILFQFFAGRLPFPAERDTTTAGLALALEDRSRPLPDLRILNPAVPPAAVEFVTRLLEPDPERRYSSARAFIGDARRHLRTTPLPLPARRWWWFGD